jgi:lipoprotein-releasing system permease protein
MVVSRTTTDGLLIRGIDMDREARVTSVTDYVRPAGFRFGLSDSAMDRIVIGKEAAYSLKVALGDTVLLARGEISGSFAGIAPTFSRYVVGGFFDSGMYEYDASYGYLDLDASQRLAGLGDRVTGLSIRLEDMEEAPFMAQGLSVMLGPGFIVSDWIQLNRNLFTWMSMEKKVMFIILNLIIVVAAFNIASTLIMVVMQRVRDIGILRSLGASAGAIMRVFMLHGLIIGVIGTSIGIAGGIILAEIVNRYRLIQLPGDVYFIDTVPVLLKTGDVLTVGGVALLICFLATLYPAWRASALVPVEAIRYE